MKMKREVRVGIFLSGVFLILALLILFVGDVQELFKKQGYRVYAVFDTALGLEKNASVKLAGIKIGLVKDITLDGRRAKVMMSIYPAYRIPHGSRATLASLGILGEKYVEIIPGKEETFFGPEEIMDSLPPISFDQLGTLFLSIGEEVKKVSNSINNILGKDFGPNLQKTLANLESLSGELDSLIKENRISVHQAVENSGKTFDNLNRQVDKVSAGIQDTLEEVQGLIRENKPGVKDNLDKLKEDLTKLKQTLESLNSTLEKIEKGQGTVGKLVNEPTLYEEVKETVNQAKKITSLVSAIKVTAGAQGTYYGESELFKGSLSAGLSWKDRAIFSAGLTHNPWQDKFVYSLQGGWKFRSLVLRAGLIESKFGAGFDWYLLKERIVLGAEGFDFNRQPRPQFRLYSRVYPAKNIYLLLGLDDFSLASQRELFFGLGFEFR
jgi:phospholipid/cholesterol/gamma-HCH transport system substrate-binding protein